MPVGGRAAAAVDAAEDGRYGCPGEPRATTAALPDQVLDTARRLQAERGVSLLLITHDPAAVWRMVQRVAVHGATVARPPMWLSHTVPSIQDACP